MQLRYLILLALFSLLLRCQADGPAGNGTVSYLYVGQSGTGSLYRFGDVVTAVDDDLRLLNIVTGRDTLLLDPGAALRPSGPGFVALPAPSSRLTPERLQQTPYHYRVDSVTYWASFEPAFTGFPEYTRPGTRDFINRLADWGGTAPGLEYSEYRIDASSGLPILMLSERKRGRYVETVAIVVDSVGAQGFAGQLYRPGNPLPRAIDFTAVSSGTATLDPTDFIERVNAGYSRSYLLLPRPTASSTDATKRLPRRALIDEGDLGTISASFLDDGTFMFLSDDHIVLQGSYVLDLDKGLLTITEEAGPVYRIFLEASPGIVFTLPVSVLRLEGTLMQGYDNYLRIEVVQLPDA